MKKKYISIKRAIKYLLNRIIIILPNQMFHCTSKSKSNSCIFSNDNKNNKKFPPIRYFLIPTAIYNISMSPRDSTNFSRGKLFLSLRTFRIFPKVFSLSSHINTFATESTITRRKPLEARLYFTDRRRIFAG